MVSHILDQPRIGRFYFLDKLRFFCAFGVLLYHYTTISQAPNKHSVYDYPTLDAVFRYGYLGVDVFFMISGFVIFFSCRSKSALNFLQGRFIRIFPAYWFSVILTSTITIFFGGFLAADITLSQFLVNLSMLQQFLGIPHVDGVYWSLTYELVFYFWIAFMLVVFHEKTERHIIDIFGALTLLSLVNFFFPFPRLIANFLILDWVYYFYIGMLLAATRLRQVTSINIQFLKCRLMIAILPALLYSDRKAMEISNWHKTQVSGGVAMIIVMCAVLYILVGVFYKNKGGSELALGQHKSFINRFSTYMGGLTYPLYLIHGVNGIILMNLLHGAGVSGSLALSITILFVFLASAFVYSVVENNFSVLLGRYLRSNKQ